MSLFRARSLEFSPVTWGRLQKKKTHFYTNSQARGTYQYEIQILYHLLSHIVFVKEVPSEDSKC